MSKPGSKARNAVIFVFLTLIALSFTACEMVVLGTGGLSGTYYQEFEASTSISFSGKIFVASYNGDKMSGSYTVSGNSLTLHVQLFFFSIPSGKWKIIDDNTLESTDGVYWIKRP